VARLGSTPLVGAEWLAGHLGDPDVVVVDCRFQLGERGAGERDWRAAHIPGASFLDVDRDLSGEPGERGRHPLPAEGDFQRAARGAGIREHALVVAYDEAGEGGAARLWWLLRHFGHERAAVLDGGLRGWREYRGPLRAGAERPQPGDFVARPREGDTVGPAEVSGGGWRLVDARAPQRYRGEREPIDPLAGHIPGALNVPFTELAPAGRFLPAEELRERLGEAGGDGFVAYCGSGVTACTVVLAAELAGVGPALLYPGSWSEWAGRGYPVARQDNARSTDSRSSGPGGVRSA
jgi:thiosulfate/3-mercaptopyruvate sulfurtransferase